MRSLRGDGDALLAISAAAEVVASIEQAVPGISPVSPGPLEAAALGPVGIVSPLWPRYACAKALIACHMLAMQAGEAALQRVARLVSRSGRHVGPVTSQMLEACGLHMRSVFQAAALAPLSTSLSRNESAAESVSSVTAADAPVQATAPLSAPLDGGGLWQPIIGIAGPNWTSAQFLAAVKGSAEQDGVEFDATAFSSQWLSQTGVPRIIAAWAVDVRRKTVEVVLEQVRSSLVWGLSRTRPPEVVYTCTTELSS
jgi:hypothetical protein